MQRDLVERATVGDHEAFSELARLWIDRLYAVARLILRDDDAAQDATQEALVVAWRDVRMVRDPQRFDSWLRQVLVGA
jgi:RNA polymerase sigma-70 factor (ECF subfamily)